jgi:hypothetical protein
LVENVLLQGLPIAIHHRIKGSEKKLEKVRPVLLKYLPHAALASVLCMVTNQNADAAGWVWGKKIVDVKLYGCMFSDIDTNIVKVRGWRSWVDMFINPFFYWNSVSNGAVISNTEVANICVSLFSCMIQTPKLFIWLSAPMITKKARQRRISAKIDRDNRKIEEKNQRNKAYIEDVLSQINAIVSFHCRNANDFNSPMGSNVIPANYLADIQLFIDDHQHMELWNNSELKMMIDQRIEKLNDIKTQYKYAMGLHKQVQDKCSLLKNSLKKSVPLYLLKEFEFIEQELSSENMKYLLADWRWDEFITVLQFLMSEIERLKKLTLS